MWLFIRTMVAFLMAIVIFGCSSKKPVVMTYQHPTMKPYSVNGVTYHPTVVKVGTKYRGIASWYGPDFHGKKTSNGEIYDMYAYTAAHKTLPMNTKVRVTNLSNGKSVVVRINDRGPFVKNRIIDLSYAAAKQIGIVQTGTAPVELEVLEFGSSQDIQKVDTGVVQEVVIDDYMVQIAAFRRYEGAKITQQRNALVDGRYRAIIKKFEVDGKPLYRVWLSGFKSEQEARDFISRGRYPGAFLVRN